MPFTDFVNNNIFHFMTPKVNGLIKIEDDINKYWIDNFFLSHIMGNRNKGIEREVVCLKVNIIRLAVETLDNYNELYSLLDDVVKENGSDIRKFYKCINKLEDTVIHLRHSYWLMHRYIYKDNVKLCAEKGTSLRSLHDIYNRIKHFNEEILEGRYNDIMTPIWFNEESIYFRVKHFKADGIDEGISPEEVEEKITFLELYELTKELCIFTEKLTSYKI